MKLQDVILRDTRANQPAASASNNGYLYFVTDELVLERSNGTAWQSYSPAGGGSVSNQYILYSGTPVWEFDGSEQSLYAVHDFIQLATDDTYTNLEEMPDDLKLSNPLDLSEPELTALEDGIWEFSCQIVIPYISGGNYLIGAGCFSEVDNPAFTTAFTNGVGSGLTPVIGCSGRIKLLAGQTLKFGLHVWDADGVSGSSIGTTIYLQKVG